MTAIAMPPTNREELLRWLKALPPRWDVVRGKVALREVDQRSLSGEELLLSLSKEQGIVPRSQYGDANGRADSLVGYKIVHPGEIVMNKMQAWNGMFGLSTRFGIVSPEYTVLQVLPGFDARFLCYQLRSDFYAGQFSWRSRGMGTAFFRLHPENLLDTPLLSPPEPLQRAIADYLDAEMARIDALIAKKQRMIDLAVERLRTLVTVLTDVGPYVQIRRLISLRTSGPRGWADLVTETGAPFIRSANLQRESIEIRTDNLVYVTPPMTEEAMRSIVHDGDVLVGITGANTGWVGCVHSDLVGSFVSQHVAILRPASVEPQWLAYSLFSQRAQDQLLGSQYGGTKQQLGLEDLAELRIACPDLEEQQRRTRAMTSAHSATKRIVVLLEGQVGLLRERRQALITAAVTGELEIPIPEAVA